jgi:hypothetical protein
VSSTTWTPTEVGSNAGRHLCSLWRAVEAQHRVSTIALVDTLEEQALLEELLEDSKPALPPEAKGLHYLLSTPFRYPPSPYGSRFRGPIDPGVFYGADEIRTACAELGYWRWRFLMDCPGLEAIDAKPQTVFRTQISTTAVDLRRSPFVVSATLWTHPTDYIHCQQFASLARQAEVGAIRYESVRDPKKGECVAVLHPRAFKDAPLEVQTWLLSVAPRKVFWHRDSPISPETFEFDMHVWATRSAVNQSKTG